MLARTVPPRHRGRTRRPVPPGHRGRPRRPGRPGRLVPRGPVLAAPAPAGPRRHLPRHGPGPGLAGWWPGRGRTPASDPRRSSARASSLDLRQRPARSHVPRQRRSPRPLRPSRSPPAAAAPVPSRPAPRPGPATGRTHAAETPPPTCTPPRPAPPHRIQHPGQPGQLPLYLVSEHGQLTDLAQQPRPRSAPPGRHASAAAGPEGGQLGQHPVPRRHTRGTHIRIIPRASDILQIAAALATRAGRLA